MNVVTYMNIRFTTRMAKQRNDEEQKPPIFSSSWRIRRGKRIDTNAQEITLM